MVPIGLIVWLVLAFLVAGGARNRGRSGLVWFLPSCLQSPIIAGIALVVLGSRRARISSRWCAGLPLRRAAGGTDMKMTKACCFRSSTRRHDRWSTRTLL